MSGDTVPDALRDLAAAWAWWLLPLAALAILAASIFAPGMQSGHSVVIIAPAPDPQAHWANGARLHAARNGPAPVSAFQGRDVYDHAGEKVGTVTQLVPSPEGYPARAVVSVGRSLGIGEDYVTVPIAALQFSQRNDGDVRLLLDDTACLADCPVPGHARFATPALKEAIPATVPAPIERSGGMEQRD